MKYSKEQMSIRAKKYAAADAKNPRKNIEIKIRHLLSSRMKQMFNSPSYSSATGMAKEIMNILEGKGKIKHKTVFYFKPTKGI